jgi:CelD/BcsL family acetyltransferase involved in cellulose biosynthesis/GNAT superfamily N-acetyltransferase
MMSVRVPVTIEIVRGAAADRLLADAPFCAEWAGLCDACPWATPFQAPGFARTWYAVYRNQWEPLFALSRDASGRLNGILPLAVSPDARQLVLAGAHQAEYQTWVARPEVGEPFIAHAIQSLRRAVPKAALRFHYLPPGSPLDWLKEPHAKRACLLRTHRRPRMEFGDGAGLLASLAKRSNKSRLKRFAKVGPVEFKQLTDPAQLETFMDEMILFHDARRMAVNGGAPFADDPLKRRFHVEMMKVPGLLHVTALTCGDRIASFQLNTIGRGHVQLSLITHNPLLADHSPGKIHVLLLGRMLLEQGYEWIDLTPGGDPYKERFATAWDNVHTLTVFGGALEKGCAAIVESVHDHAKQALSRWNVRPAYAKALAFKLMRPSGVVHLAKRWLGTAQEARIYAHALGGNASTAADERIRRDAIDDLMAYHPDHGGPTRQEFLSDAMRRIEEGQRAYTYAENGRLLHVSWFAAAPSKEQAAVALPRFELPEKHGLIIDCYTFPHARGRGLGAASVAAMLRDAASVKDLRGVFIAVPANSATARRLVERAGFTYDRPCVRRFSEM